MTSFLISILNGTVVLMCTFFLLYPFYLRDKHSKYYKGVWLLIGDLFKNRYGVIIVLNGLIGNCINIIIVTYTHKRLFAVIAMAIYLIFVSFVVLWYPFYLKEKKPYKYKNIWKFIGEWLGDPQIAFPSIKNKRD